MSKINTKIRKKKKLNTADNLEKQISGSFRCAKNRTIAVPLLYRVVYSSKLSFTTVFILLLSFVFQGASLTYADEISESNPLTQGSASTPMGAESSEGGTPEHIIESPIPIPDVTDLSPGQEDELLNLTASEQPTPVNDLLTDYSEPEATLDVTPDPSPPLDDPPISDGDEVLEEADGESLPNNDVLEFLPLTYASTTSTSSDINNPPVIADSAATSSEESVDLKPETEGSPDDVVATTSSPITTASTTATTTIEMPELPVTVTTSDTEFTFNRNECTTLASGSFYCLKADPGLMEDALFAAPDVDGDLEIYLVRDGIQSQVTRNQADDAAPFFDQNSDTIVWHRLIDDRYQIISYDISSGEESQLTVGHTNSMEPTRQGKYTVWQNWSNNNWNVVLFDGKEQRTITESTAHDIAPYVHGSLVVWNRYSNGQDKTIEMYDMISETYVTVDDPEGLSVTNPRMVFVYDSLHPNGDVVTKGYDMIARKFIQLDTLPRQLPDEIPESESTGETRALIQSKPTVKSDEISHNNNATSSGPTPPNLTSPTTSADALTLDLSVPTSTELIIAPVLEVPVMAEYELIIPPLEYGTETVQE